MMIRMRFSIHPIKEEAIPNAGDLIETEEGTDDLIMKDITGEETKKDNMKTEDIPMEIGIIETTGTDKETKVMAEMTGMSSEEEVITPAVERLTKGLEELPVEEAVITGMTEAPVGRKADLEAEEETMDDSPLKMQSGVRMRRPRCWKKHL